MSAGTSGLRFASVLCAATSRRPLPSDESLLESVSDTETSEGDSKGAMLPLSGRQGHLRSPRLGSDKHLLRLEQTAKQCRALRGQNYRSVLVTGECSTTQQSMTLMEKAVVIFILEFDARQQT